MSFQENRGLIIWIFYYSSESFFSSETLFNILTTKNLGQIARSIVHGITFAMQSKLRSESVQWDDKGREKRRKEDRE